MNESNRINDPISRDQETSDGYLSSGHGLGTRCGHVLQGLPLLTDLTNSGPAAETGGDGTAPTVSRRSLLRASAAGLGTGILLSGPTGHVDAATTTTANGDTVAVTDDFTLINNQWGNPDAEQSVSVADDGRYGWELDASGTSPGINYPEVLIGTKPWGTDTGTSHFPIQRGDVEEFILDVYAESDISSGEWDWAQEWCVNGYSPTSPLGDDR